MYKSFIKLSLSVQIIKINTSEDRNMSANKDRGMFNQPGVDSAQIMRGRVMSNVDPRMEGRIAVNIPRITPDGDPSADGKKDKQENVDTSVVENSEVTDAVGSTIGSTNTLWARMMKGVTGSYTVPYEGQTVYCFMEDGDPSKLYYYPLIPTLNGQTTEMDRIRSTFDKYTPARRPLIHILHEFKDGTTLYYDENSEHKELQFITAGGQSFSIRDSEEFKQIELLTAGGLKVLLDDFNSQLTATTPSGHALILSDEVKQKKKKEKPKMKAGSKSPWAEKDEEQDYPTNPAANLPNQIQLRTAGGSSISMSGDGNNISLVNSGGAKVNMAGGNISAEAGGGTVKIGGGRVQIN